MPSYIVLANYTEQGIRTIKDSPRRTNAGKALARRFGGRIQQFYLTMGAYDFVAVFDMPNDEAMAKFLLATGTAGNARTTTLKAFGEPAFRRIVRGVPLGAYAPTRRAVRRGARRRRRRAR